MEYDGHEPVYDTVCRTGGMMSLQHVYFIFFLSEVGN